jgi:hypothetical protein
MIKILKSTNYFFTLYNYEKTYRKSINYNRYVPTILKLSYDEDLLSEEFLMGWSNNQKD